MAEVPQYRLGEVERKLLTLYALRELGPCNNLQLIAFMTENDLMNYFDLQLALYELAQRGQVLKEPVCGDERYTITPEGEQATELFVSRLGESALVKLRAAVPDFSERMRKERELFAQISHESRNEYHAQMGIAEGGMQLLRLDLSLPTAELADRFRAAWAENAREIYDFIINRLSGEDLP
ncbi:MAG: DUF4364 family protein [Clostridiales bacterium]|nr:DUF4364 family protein [Clostridiales bacterium]